MNRPRLLLALAALSLGCTVELNSSDAVLRQYCEKVVECGAPTTVEACKLTLEAFTRGDLTGQSDESLRACGRAIREAPCGTPTSKLDACESGFELSTVGADPECAPMTLQVDRTLKSDPPYVYRFASENAYGCWSRQAGSPSGCVEKFVFPGFGVTCP